MQFFDPDNRARPELDEIERRLAEERPTLTALELDRIKLAVKQRAGRRGARHVRKGTLMKSRLAVTMLLVLGVMMSGTGATLAITGASGSGDAAVSQYQSVGPDAEGDGNSLGGVSQGGGTPGDDVQAAEQVAAAGGSSSSLPFTGFFTIPLIVGGVALLATGAVMRRRIGESA